MTLYARSEAVVSVKPPAGCGKRHDRPAPHGIRSAIWPLTCDPCEVALAGDPWWGRMPPRSYGAEGAA